MNTVYLLLGSNLGNSKEQLLLAIKNIEDYIGTVIKFSSLYSTAAWGYTKQPDFLNQVIIIETVLQPILLLKKILAVEKKMGRVRTVKNAARIIDIDILFFNSEIINTKNLVIPHPEIENRRFVLIPLAEMNELLIHPVSKRTIMELLKICPDKLNVQKI
ncbi:MAG: 2-amino-4-hydroxy-6-hydroxymethyldihydropteridine diphosphokinase [Ferruginibacter sp.]|nr:2-amino-4-hydroxy-6-hydroxymethyldihydropteridine diphosphokinase [Ferruginibacter sp.]